MTTNHNDPETGNKNQVENQESEPILLKPYEAARVLSISAGTLQKITWPKGDLPVIRQPYSVEALREWVRQKSK